MKKFIALLVVLAMALSLAGCADTRHILTFDGVEIAPGIYILAQIEADEQAYDRLIELFPDVDREAKNFDRRNFKLDDMDYVDWVKERALEITARVLVAEQLFRERGLEFTVQEELAMKAALDEKWGIGRLAEMLVAEYGPDARGWAGPDDLTWEQFSQKNGISRESFDRFYTSRRKEVSVFDDMYSNPDSADYVAKEVWHPIVEEKFVSVKMFWMSNEDSDHEELSEEALEDLRALSASFIERISAGELTFAEAQKEYDEFVKERDYVPHECDDDCEDPCKLAEEDDKTPEDTPAEPHECDDDCEDPCELIEEPDDSANGGDDNNDDDDDPHECDEDCEDPCELSEEEDEDLKPFFIRINEFIFDIEDFDPDEKDEDDKFVHDSNARLVYHITQSEIGDIHVYQAEDGDWLIERMDVFEDEESVEAARDPIVIELKVEEFNNNLRETAKAARNDGGRFAVNEAAFKRYNPKRIMND
jgi:hypothetical protein